MKKLSKKILLLLPLLLTQPVLSQEPNNTIVKSLDLPQLLQLFSQNKQSQADFKEEKHAFFLDKPLLSSGYLQFTAPDKLNKFILAPKKISQKIDGNELTLNNGEKTHIINLEDHPEFSIILTSIISVLAGDHAALEKNFKIKFENKISSWMLLLSPRDDFAASYVESIQMFGMQNILSKIIVKEPNDDTSITKLYNHR